MQILYYNNCWFTNVGEAFIDLGSMQLIKRIINNPQIINVSNMTRIYIELTSKREKIENPYRENSIYFKMLENYVADYFICSGMFACEEFLNSDTATEILRLSSQGVKIIFLGLGQATYTEKEVSLFREFLSKLSCFYIMTRDDITYENLSDMGSVIKGIDCAFWAKDTYDPRLASNSTINKYDIVAYNRSLEPAEFLSKSNVVRPYHMQWKFSSHEFKSNIFISDTPYDYLTLYANADNVYTDLVHGTIAGLQYGKHVRFDRVDNRGFAINALDNLKVDKTGMVYILEKDLEMQKQIIEEKLQALLWGK